MRIDFEEATQFPVVLMHNSKIIQYKCVVTSWDNLLYPNVNDM
jgi:hypothetical protein